VDAGNHQELQPYLTDIRQLIVAHFNTAELQNLCFSLKVDYEDLPEGGKSDKARELLLYLSRRARVLELVDYIRTQRPSVNWTYILQEFSSNHLLLERVKPRIDTASFVIADLTSFDPNTLLLVGYAWGIGCPTILLAKKGGKLPFDVRGQRCLVYSGIKGLSKMLSKELVVKGKMAS